MQLAITNYCELEKNFEYFTIYNFGWVKNAKDIVIVFLKDDNSNVSACFVWRK